MEEIKLLFINYLRSMQVLIINFCSDFSKYCKSIGEGLNLFTNVLLKELEMTSNIFKVLRVYNFNLQCFAVHLYHISLIPESMTKIRVRAGG